MVVIDGHVFLCLTSMVVALLKQVTVLFLNRHFRGKCMCLWGRFACEKCPFSFFLSYFSTKSPQPKMALGMTYRSLPGRHLVSRQMSPMGKKRNWRLAAQYTRLLALFLLQVGASVCSQNWPLISPHVQQLGCSMKFVYVYFLPKKWGGFFFLIAIAPAFSNDRRHPPRLPFYERNISLSPGCREIRGLAGISHGQITKTSKLKKNERFNSWTIF